jgi:BirA family biotin operon repressor/biotin-[acetyl-CoA-carboxylase] ligase
VTSFGSPHRHLRRTDSTNARARELAIAGAPGGLVVTADEQSAGRGRQGRSWFAPAGTSLLYSALLRPLGERPLLPLAVPLAVCDAAESLVPGIRCGLKWPNDVWIDGRKVAGVLIESRPGEDSWAVIGIGINVAVPPDAFPDELGGTATSLAADATGETHPRVSDALATLNDVLPAWVDADADEILGSFRERDALAGRRIGWGVDEGEAAGIDDRGHLLVRTDSGETHALGAGEVHLTLS